MLRPLSHSLTDPEDLRLSGHVYSTGNSTLEITVRLQSVSRSRGLADTPETILMGRFTMACRSKETGRAHPVPKLITQSPDEQRLESLGKEQKQKKMLALKQSLQTNPPNEEESRMIHNVFTKFADWYKPGAHVPEEVVWMKKGTQLSSVLMCHPQERNVHGNVFVSQASCRCSLILQADRSDARCTQGGYLMRL
jgi:acyl-coenzyme A thioesterase 9